MSSLQRFIVNRRTIESALSLCHKVYEGALGVETPPESCRVATDPLDVIADMADVLRAARERIIENQKSDRE